MYAIVEILGKQIRVSKSQEIVIPKINEEIGNIVTFDKVLLSDDGMSINVGAPYISNASLRCKVEDHIKDNKVLVFKKKRRTGYQKRQGHRQQYTKVLVEDIILK